MRREPKALLRAVVLLSPFLLGACLPNELARRDSLGFGAGNAVATNIATHVIDPWPPASRTLYAPTNGERIQHAVERYRTGAQSGSLAQAAGVTGGAPTSAGAPTVGTSPSLR